MAIGWLLSSPLVLILVLVLFGTSVCSEQKEGNFEVTIRMPNATSKEPDDYVCHSYKVPDKETYILRYIPHATSHIQHHMMVYGCGLPGNDKPFWSCRQFEDNNAETSVCGGGRRQVVYAWAMDAPAMYLPEGVGFRVGGTTGIDYLVLQMHYKTAFGVDAADNSGVTLQMTYDRQPQQAGFYILGSYAPIPPQQPAFKLESACVMDLNYTIYPIGYRTHGHNIAVVNSGYRIRNGTWVELGRMSPQRPQTFYNVTTPGLDVHEGDKLASRCTFNSMSRNTTTSIGPTNVDEMCNFYILYATYEQKDLEIAYCFRGERFAWKDFFPSTPPDASSLRGIPGAEEIRHQFNLDPRKRGE